MSGPRYRPKRRIRSEIIPLAVIMSLPVALWIAFPTGAIGFKPVTHHRAESVYNAFVSLDVEREAELLVAARAAWQSDSSSRRGVRANLLCCGTSDTDRIMSGVQPSVRPAVDVVEAYESDFMPPGFAAESPAMLESDKESVAEPAFPRTDLLKLN